MITAISVEWFRGIAHGELQDLGPLTLLTGPNGCGKSTILDALLIATSPRPHDAVGQAVQRHPATRDGARWLVGVSDDLEAQAKRPTAILAVTEDSKGESIECQLTWAARSTEITCFLKGAGKSTTVKTKFSADNSYSGLNIGKGLLLSDVRLVDPGLPVPLDKTYSEAVRQGRKKEALSLLADLVPGLEDLEILTEDDGTPTLYVVTADKGVPVGLSGDGVQAFLQLALELAASPGGLVLVEEPEVYQHPRSIRQGAKALLAAMRRGVQLVITTHSLELIDAVVGQATAEDLEQVVLFNLALSEGELRSSRFPGPEIEFARGTLENDLR